MTCNTWPAQTAVPSILSNSLTCMVAAHVKRHSTYPGGESTHSQGVVQIGVYNELSLQRLDLILAEAGKNGVRIIFPFVNYWSDLGGMQWYVDQVCLHFRYCITEYIYAAGRGQGCSDVCQAGFVGTS